MRPEAKRLWRLVVLSATVAAVAGCGGDDPAPAPATPPAPPAVGQLTPAVGAALAGSCADLAARLATFSGATIGPVSTVAAGTLSVGGNPVPEHCLLTGSMANRVSSVDGNTYEIKFQMRLPVAWNGRFLH